MRSSTSRHGHAIRFHVDALHRLNQEVMEGFNAEPRPNEVAGLLIGSLDPAEPALIIEAIEPVPCPPGPEYPWDDAARQALEQAIAQWQPDSDQRLMVLGYYRSHIRPGLFLSPHDHSLLRTYFSQPTCACLLIKPSVSSPCVGKFFTWHEGFMREDSRALEFPPYGGPNSAPKHDVTATMLPPPRSSHAAGAGTAAAPAMTPMRAPVPAPIPEPARREVPMRTEMPARAEGLARLEASARPQSSSIEFTRPPLPPIPEIPQPAPELRRSRPLLWTALAVAGVVALGYVGWVNRKDSPFRVERTGGPVVLGLAVERKGSDLRVSWDRGAPLIVSAHRGILSITDGGNYRQLEFDPNQLREGSLLYTPESGDVTLRLEVFAQDLSRSGESVRVMGRPAQGGWLSSLPPIPDALDVRIGDKKLSARLGLTPAPTARATKPPVSTTEPAAPSPAPAVDQAAPATGTAESASKPADTGTPAAPGSVVLREVPTLAPTFVTSAPPPSNEPAAPPPAPAAAVPTPSNGQPTATQTAPDAAKPIELKVIEPTPLQIKPPDPKPAETVSANPRIASYAGPKATNRVFPIVPTGVRRLIVAETDIEIKVSIDATGKVTNAVPVTSSGPLAGHLGALASSAARLWRFTPANRNGVNVPSEQVLKFVFQKESQ